MERPIPPTTPTIVPDLNFSAILWEIQNQSVVPLFKGNITTIPLESPNQRNNTYNPHLPKVSLSRISNVEWRSRTKTPSEKEYIVEFPDEEDNVQEETQVQLAEIEEWSLALSMTYGMIFKKRKKVGEDCVHGKGEEYKGKKKQKNSS